MINRVKPLLLLENPFLYVINRVKPLLLLENQFLYVINRVKPLLFLEHSLNNKTGELVGPLCVNVTPSNECF